MNKRILSGVRLLFLALLLVASAAPLAEAQGKQEPLYGYSFDWSFPRAQWDDFNKAVEASRPIKERLVNNGTLLSWGATASIVHTADGFTHTEWFQANSLENILKALDELSKTSLGPPFTSATKHANSLYLTLMHDSRTVSVSSGFLAVSLWPVKAGRDQEFEGLFKKYYQPWLDQMVAEGSALRYTFNTQIVHTTTPGLYSLGVVLRDGASYDKFQANVRTMLEQNPALHGALGEVTVVEGYRDALLRILAYQHK
jgi:hypothetical protein